MLSVLIIVNFSENPVIRKKIPSGKFIKYLGGRPKLMQLKWRRDSHRFLSDFGQNIRV